MHAAAVRRPLGKIVVGCTAAGSAVTQVESVQQLLSSPAADSREAGVPACSTFEREAAWPGVAGAAGPSGMHSQAAQSDSLQESAFKATSLGHGAGAELTMPGAHIEEPGQPSVVMEAALEPAVTQQIQEMGGQTRGSLKPALQPCNQALTEAAIADGNQVQSQEVQGGTEAALQQGGPGSAAAVAAASPAGSISLPLREEAAAHTSPILHQLQQASASSLGLSQDLSPTADDQTSASQSTQRWSSPLRTQHSNTAQLAASATRCTFC